MQKKVFTFQQAKVFLLPKQTISEISIPESEDQFS